MATTEDTHEREPAPQSMTTAVVPFATVRVGVAIDGAGVVPTVRTLGATFLGVLRANLFNPALRRMDHVGRS